MGTYSSATRQGAYEPFELQVSRGQVDGHSVVNIFGNTTSLGSTAYGPLWEGLTGTGGTYAYPASAVVMTLASSSASDTAVTIRVEGLGAGFVDQYEDVVLNGTTGVNTTKTFLRINRMETWAGNAVGAVSATNGGTLYARITAGNGVTQMSLFTVPAGYTFYQTYYQADTNTSATSGAYVRLRTYQVHRERVGEVVTAELQTAFVQQLTIPLQFPVSYPEKHDVQWQLLGAGGAGAVANVYVGGVLIKNPD